MSRRPVMHGVVVTVAALVAAGCGAGDPPASDDAGAPDQAVVAPDASAADLRSPGGDDFARSPDLRVAGEDLVLGGELGAIVDGGAAADLSACPGGCDGGVCERDAGLCVECLRDGDCGPGGACCARRCVDPMISPANCGGCGKACAFDHASAECKAGGCVLGACAAGFADCNGSPVDGCETSVTSDVKNCGGCGQLCARPNAMVGCLGGACGLAACNPGFRNCDGNAQNGCEINSDSDPANCGGCGSSCAQLPHAMAQCAAGACVIGACLPGFGNCDKMDGNGCETEVSSSLAHCGACGNACPAPANVVVSCGAGKCMSGGCAQGFADCDNNMNNGCEARLASDAKNCGACGNACGGNAPNAMVGCVGGQCSFVCNPGWGNCDGNLGNGCERDTSGDAANCGACGKACANGEVCVMALCVSCAAGRYEGPAMATALGFNVAGTISFTLGAPNAGVLTVTKGTLTMTGPQMASANATVGGTLDCNSKKFSGTLTNGTATALGLPPLPFTGTAPADYVLNPPSFANGTITVMGGLVGNGSWSAAYLGP